MLAEASARPLQADTTIHSAQSIQLKASMLNPEAASDDCSTSNFQHHALEHSATSSQVVAEQTASAHTNITLLPVLRSKRKQPEPPLLSASLDQSDPLKKKAGAKQESLMRTSAPESSLQNKRKSRRKPAKSTAPAHKSAESAPVSGKRKNKYNFAGVLGRTVDIAAPVFGVEIPDLFYRGVVLKKDAAHAGAVIVRFVEDGSRYWFPVSEVERFLRDMEQHGRNKGSETIGQGSDAFAAEILAGALAARRQTSETTASSAIEGSQEAEVSTGAHPGRGQPPLQQLSHPNPTQARLPQQAPCETTGASLLQELAAAADSGQAQV